MRADDIADRIERGGARRPAGRQLELLEEVLAIYERDGLLAGRRPDALWRCCPNRDACWSSEQLQHRPGVSDADPDSEKGCIFAPWIGPAYEPGGVCVVAVNLRYDGGDWDLAVEHRVATGAWGQEEMLRAGRRRAHHSPFAWRSLTGAAAILRSGEGRTPVEAEGGDELAQTLLRTARLQSVKCSPNDHRRSQRSRAMRELCPPRFLRSEIEILEPGVLLAFGGEARSALERSGEVVYREQERGFLRGSYRGVDHQAEVFVLAHPAARGATWQRSQRALLASLVRRRSQPTPTSPT